MSKTKSSGTTKNNRDSKPKYLGVKLYGGQKAKPGSIIVRQVGTKFIPGKGVTIGADSTIYSLIHGVVEFQAKKAKKFDGKKLVRKVVHVVAA